MTSAAKVLRFPLSGIARDLDYRKAYIPSEQTAFATPYAVNVIGECPIAERQRGGSRPGLRAFTGTQPTETDTGSWMWPNGTEILWANGNDVIFDTIGERIITPDGSILIDQHERFTVVATKGAIPADCTAMAMYRARMVVAKDEMWYASRQGDVNDFDYGGDGEDVGRAAAGSVALAGRRGEGITALAAIQDSALFVATKRQLRMISGEPTSGQVTIVSEHTGIISRDAWCFDGSRLWFMGENGMYSSVVGESSAQRVSGRLPEDFKGFTSATLVYDPEKRAVNIFALRGSVRHDWYYDIENDAFWRMEYSSAKAPIMGATAVIGDVNRAIFKCADGVWRYFDDNASTDDGTTITSKVAIGPIRSSVRDDMDGMVAEVMATIADASADVRCDIYTANSPELAVKRAEAGTATEGFTISHGWNNVVRPRKRGAWAVFVLSSTGKWGYESMTAVFKMLGRLR